MSSRMTQPSLSSSHHHITENSSPVAHHITSHHITENPYPVTMKHSGVTTILCLIILLCPILVVDGLQAVSAHVASETWTLYKSMLSQHPLATKSVTSSVLMTFSDAICQQLTKGGAAAAAGQQHHKTTFDYKRSCHVAITGFVWSGPVTHNWYSILEKIVTIKNPIGGLVARIVLDAIIFSPVTVCGYFTCRSILEGSGVAGIRDKLSSRFVTAVTGAWKFWPAANIFNFGLVPVEFRVLYSNVLSLFWTGYLTLLNAKEKIASKKTP
jgi:hypothetical protein